MSLDPTPQSRVERTNSIWRQDVEVPVFPTLSESKTVDVCIVGAGIAGLSVAYQLAKAGRKVLVLDEHGLGAGESGQTSAHLASANDDRFSQLEKVLGHDGAVASYQGHAAAIDSIEDIVQDEGIDCDFQRLDGYLFLAEGQDVKELDDELAAAYRAGAIDARKLDRAPVDGIDTGPCIRFPNQARFHPLKYLVGLARAIEKLGGEIVQGVRATDMTGDEKTGNVTIETSSGHSISANVGVAATNVPDLINNWAGIYTKQAAYRTYMIGMRVDPGAISDALYWDNADPYRYARLTDSDGQTTLIIGGEDHRTGQADDAEDRFDKLEAWTRRKFPAVQDVVIRWSGQVNEPDDYLGYIGRVPTSNHANCYLVTGDSGMGLTHGALAGLIIRDLVLGKENPWAKAYDPGRTSLSVRSVTEFVRENVSSASHYLDYVTRGRELKSPEELAAGCAAVITVHGKKIAAYRDETGELHQCSAVCTHLKGLLAWNSLEKSWDCPVHGSRFDPDGKMLTGPAIDDLEKTRS
ncbi:MAG: FAD-dependent oxidoreductase [Tepidisphaeraceae bacterium]